MTVAGATQLAALQQPVWQDVPSHTHWPRWQCCPDAHGGPPPHWQAPKTQLSDTTPQNVHEAPPTPHVYGEGIV